MTKAATKNAAVAAIKPVAAAANKEAATSEALLVRTKQGVARRCRSGIAFGPEAKAVPLGDLTDEQLEAILADPMLEVPQPDAAGEGAVA